MKTEKFVSFKEIDQTLEYSAWDLVLCKSLHELIRALQLFSKNKNMAKTYPATLHSMRWSLDIAYIVTLSKIFDKGEGLLKIIKQIVNLDEDSKKQINAKAYSEFFSQSNQFLNEIKNIQKQLKPLRNKFRAHNFPDLNGPDDVNWKKVKKWEKFAEKVYDEVCRIFLIKTRMKHAYNKPQTKELAELLRRIG